MICKQRRQELGSWQSQKETLQGTNGPWQK